jgi:hypothetical protein
MVGNDVGGRPKVRKNAKIPEVAKVNNYPITKVFKQNIKSCYSPESVPVSREEVSHHRNAEVYLECHKTGPYRLKENDARISDRRRIRFKQ